MKRVRCPKCDNYIVFDDKNYSDQQSLVFQCPQCNKQFSIKIGVSKLKKAQREENENPDEIDAPFGSLIVIENVFHFKQVLPLKMGDNSIGRYMKGSKTTLPIETVDPSVDMLHCYINVSKNKKGELKFTLRDGPSYTGTFVNNEILGDKERRIIEDGTLFTIGATSIILNFPK